MLTTLQRALRVLTSFHSRSVATLPSRAEARALGARLARQGKAVVVYPAQQGFTVAEVAK